MKRTLFSVVAVLAIAFALPLASVQQPSAHQVTALEEQRYCGVPKRDAEGRIARRADARGAFKRAHPCPANGKSSGSCVGWAVDHVIPLACGGCDAVSNMQWLPVGIKSCAGSLCKDRFERKIYCRALKARK